MQAVCLLGLGEGAPPSEAIHPPIDEPMRICGPSLSARMTASVSANQWLIFPLRNVRPIGRGRNNRTQKGAAFILGKSIEE